MIRLLRIEWKKVANNTSFWVLLGIYALILGSIFFGIQAFINEIMKDAGKNVPIPVSKISLYKFPYIWHNLTYAAGYFKIFLSLVIIIFITNEYSFKTMRQNIITGMSRWDFLLSKISMAAVISIASTLFIFIIGLVLGLTNSDELVFNDIISKIQFLLAYALEIFAFMIFAMFISILVKKSGLSIFVLMIYFYIIERWAYYKLPDDFGEFLPLRAVAKIIPFPKVDAAVIKMFEINKYFSEIIHWQHVLVTICYTSLFIFLMYIILKKRDL